ncbi:MAG TPA: substrate-binding domain-containing protein, partial [Acidimicrobiales bacterium]
VTVDDRHGTALAVDHVVGLGHTVIGHVAGPQNLSTGHRRYLGYLEAMARHQLPAPAAQVTFADAFTEAAGARACRQLIERTEGVSAIVAANDRLAIGCYDALEELELRCPQDISITGFNDMPFVDRLRPALTTVRVPQREIGSVAADLLLRQLGGEEGGVGEVLLEPSLIVRESTAPPGG